MKVKCLLIVVVALFVAGVLTVPSYAAIDPGTIEGLWLFDEGNGGVARDSSRNGRDGAITGAKWVDGKFGKALEFDGVDDMVVITGYFGVGGKDPRSTVFWWKGSDAIQHSWVKWGIESTGQKYYIRGDTTVAGKVTLRVEVQNGQSYGSINVCDGVWHHLAVVLPKGSDSVKDHLLYVDGVPEVNPAGTDLNMDTDSKATEVHIGARVTDHAFAKGIIDEVAIFKAALSVDDVKNIITRGLDKALNLTAVFPAGKLAVTWSRIKAN